MTTKHLMIYAIFSLVFSVLIMGSRFSYAMESLPNCNAGAGSCLANNCPRWGDTNWSCRSFSFDGASQVTGNSSVCVPISAEIHICQQPYTTGYTCTGLDPSDPDVAVFDSLLESELRIARTCGTHGCPNGTQCIDFPGLDATEQGAPVCARTSNCCYADAAPDGSGVDCTADASKVCCNPHPDTTCYAPEPGGPGVCAICSSAGQGCGELLNTPEYPYGGTQICCGTELLCGEDNLCHTFVPPQECPPGSDYIANGETCWESWMTTDMDECDRCASGRWEWDGSTRKVCIPQPTGGTTYSCSDAGTLPGGASCACEAGVSCNPETGFCDNTVACKAFGDICDVGGTNLPCCPGFTCDDALEPNPSVGRCSSGATCASEIAPCSGPNDCCAPDWTCNNGYCADTSGATSCAGSACGGTLGSNCAPGQICNGGSCVYDPVNCPITDPGVITSEGLPYNKYNNPIQSLSGLLGGIGKLLYAISIGIGLFFIVKSGYKYMVSEGDPRKVQEAQEELTSAVLGVFFILLSVFIMNIIIESIIGG